MRPFDRLNANIDFWPFPEEKETDVTHDPEPLSWRSWTPPASDHFQSWLLSPTANMSRSAE